METIDANRIIIRDARSGAERSIYDAILPVVRLDAQKRPLQIIGTAFSIGPSPLLLSAAHVFKEKDPRRVDRELEIPNDELGVLRFITDKGGNISWDLYKVDLKKLSETHDVAMIKVGSWSSGQRLPIFPTLKIKAEPVLGDPVIAMGYPRGFNFVDGKVVSVNLVSSKGAIQGILPTGRPNLPFPCIESTANIDNGHSGGPLFIDSSFEIVGINCSSFSGVPDLSWATHVGFCQDLKICPQITVVQGPGGRQVQLDDYSLLALESEGLSAFNR